jgi:Uncharacterized protein conserved in bacteria
MKEYIYLIVPFTALLLCQILKFIIETIQKKEIRWGRLFNGTGGMPSTHTSFTFSLAFTLMYELGIKSPIFALSLVLSMVVSYDAMGVRLETERQAQAINKLVSKVFKGRKPREWAKQLKEEIGHEPLEVLGGVLFAFVVSTFLYYFI